MDYLLKASKVLTRNDTGETHSHQSGISIIKTIANSGIFPILTTDKLNPRVSVSFADSEKNEWLFQYIYYNDYYFGKPKNKGHNEYRLTCVKEFMQYKNATAGDLIWFAIDEKGNRYIGLDKNPVEEDNNDSIIRIKSGWKMIKIK